MKKSLADMGSTDVDSSPTEDAPNKTFGAFKAVDGDQATIDLNKLREMNIFFATPCYGGMVTDQFFLSMFRTSQTFRLLPLIRISCHLPSPSKKILSIPKRL